MAATTDHRSTAEERREQVLEAGIHEFAQAGYHATRTAAIATRAGISQPYVYALFEDKKTLFLACQERVRDQTRSAFKAAWRPTGSIEESLAELGRCYRRLLDNPDAPRCQLQGYAASADPQIRDHMRQGYLEVFDFIQELTGADPGTVARFMAIGLLLNVGTVLELPEPYLRAFPQP
jgi:AcrR family transcriptional regulator